MVVGEVFRSLVSLCKNKDIKVVMPLLAAGDQVCIDSTLTETLKNFLLSLAAVRSVSPNILTP